MEMWQGSLSPSRLAIPLKMLEKLLTSWENVMETLGSSAGLGLSPWPLWLSLLLSSELCDDIWKKKKKKHEGVVVTHVYTLQKFPQSFTIVLIDVLDWKSGVASSSSTVLLCQKCLLGVWVNSWISVKYETHWVRVWILYPPDYQAAHPCSVWQSEAKQN